MNRIKRYILLFLISIWNIDTSLADISNRGRYSDFKDSNNNLDDIFIPIIAIVLAFVGFIYVLYIIKEKYSPKEQSKPIKTTTSIHGDKIKQIKKQDVTQNRETKIKELLKDPFNSRIHKLHKAIYVYCDRINNRFISFDEYLQICFYMLNLLESQGELKNTDERHKAADLLLYFNGCENDKIYTNILTNAKEIKGNPYNPFWECNTWRIYDIYKELLGEFVWKPTISTPDPSKMDMIGKGVFKNHINT